MSDIRTPDEIERDLEKNREGLQDTLRALESTFTPETILRSLTETIGRHGTEYGRSTMDAARANPLALGVTAVGLGWLMFGKGPSADRLDSQARAMASGARHRDVSVDPASLPSGDSPAGERARAQWHRTGTAPRSGTQPAAAKTQTGRPNGPSAADRVRDRSAEIGRSLSEGTEKMNATARERIVAAREQAILAAEGAERTAGKAARRSADFFEENPLVVGALALAVGGLVAVSLPHTRIEDEHLGPHSDRFYDDAERIFEEERAKIERVAGAAMDEARNVGEELRADGDAASRNLKDDADRNTSGNGSAADAVVDRSEDAVSRVATAAKRQADKEELGPKRG